jgi:hypothetical protein
MVQVESEGYNQQKVGPPTYKHGIHGDWCRGPQVEVFLTHTSVDPLWSTPSAILAGS